MSKKIHVPVKNSIAEITKRLHRCLISLSANAPIIMKYTGLITKNKRKHTAIPASSFTKVTTNHGSISITATETASGKIKFFFINPPQNNSSPSSYIGYRFGTYISIICIESGLSSSITNSQI